MVVGLSPQAVIPPAVYSQKPTQNGISHSEKIESSGFIHLPTASETQVESSECGSVDSMPITANGNAATYHATNDLNGHVAPSAIFRDTSDRKMAIDVLKVIESYGVDYEKQDGSWKGLEAFIPTVEEQVRCQEPIRMILPAFPFKSPNARDKVLGTMPDFGEELALAHLNGLCENIAQVYTPGADIYISSDGLVYNGKSMV